MLCSLEMDGTRVWSFLRYRGVRECVWVAWCPQTTFLFTRYWQSRFSDSSSGVASSCALFHSYTSLGYCTSYIISSVLFRVSVEQYCNCCNGKLDEKHYRVPIPRKACTPLYSWSWFITTKGISISGNPKYAIRLFFSSARRLCVVYAAAQHAGFPSELGDAGDRPEQTSLHVMPCFVYAFCNQRTKSTTVIHINPHELLAKLIPSYRQLSMPYGQFTVFFAVCVYHGLCRDLLHTNSNQDTALFQLYAITPLFPGVTKRRYRQRRPPETLGFPTKRRRGEGPKLTESCGKGKRRRCQGTCRRPLLLLPQSPLRQTLKMLGPPQAEKMPSEARALQPWRLSSLRTDRLGYKACSISPNYVDFAT